MNTRIKEQFARDLATIKRKLPYLGRHLDLPLAEVAYERMHTKSRSRKIFNKKRPQRAGSIQHYQPLSFFAARDKTALYDLWLTGIGSKELIAIEVLLAIGRPWRTFSRMFAFVIMAAINLSVAMLFIGDIELAPYLEAITVIAGSSLFWSIYRFLDDDRNVADTRIRLFKQHLELRAFYLRDQIEKGCAQVFMGCMGVVSGVFLGGTLIVAPALIASQFEIFRNGTAFLLYADFIVFGVAGFVWFYVDRMMSERVLKLYRKTSNQCDALFARTVWQENDQERR